MLESLMYIHVGHQFIVYTVCIHDIFLKKVLGPLMKGALSN